MDEVMRMITNGSWQDRGIILAVAAVILGVAGLIFHLASSRYLYGELKTHKGIVTDMDYTPPRTHWHHNGKTSYTTTTPAKHEVYIKLDDGSELEWNHERLYQTVRLDDEDDILSRVISPATSEVLKAATAKRTAEEILTHRLELKNEIDAGLKARLQKYGVHVSDVSIVDLHFTEEFTNAVERKQIAEQQAKQAEYVAQKATQDARATVEKAKGQANAQKLVQRTLTPAILQQMAIEKWDGKFPQVMGGQGALPFLQLEVKK